MKLRPLSNSPLLDASFCAVVLISPEALEQRSVDRSAGAAATPAPGQAIAAITGAAEVAGVPVLVLSAEGPTPTSPTRPSGPSRLRFDFEPQRSPWSHKAFVEALGSLDRAILIVAGLWFEHEILATALNALVEGYDVYVLLDASAPRSQLASAAARERLIQAGGTPITSSQVISEWSFETADASLRAELMALLPVALNMNE
jgi:nicotinamidase-related amidase